MTRLIRFIGFGLLAFGILLAWPSTHVVLAEPSADIDAGKTAWTAKSCKSCHGTNAEGKYAVPLAGTTFAAADIIAKARTDQNHAAYRADQVSDVELTNIVDYVKSLPKPASFTATKFEPKAGDSPAKTLFAQKLCAACHGENAERIGQVVVRDNRKTISPEEITKQLRTPKKFMPSFSASIVSDSDVTTLAPFIKAAVEKEAANPSPAATPAPAAPPAALPKSGSEATTNPWALAIGLTGITLIIASFILRRHTAR